jgi:hypothetical protein
MTSATTPKTIELYGHGIQHEATVTDAVITPGMLVTRTATGVRPHNVAGETATPAFAQEYGMTGRDIDDDYAIGDQCVYKVYAAGSSVYAWAHTGGAAIAANAYLKSAGDGTLELAGDDEVVIAQALEAVDNSGGSAPARIKVEIIPAQRTAPGV